MNIIISKIELEGENSLNYSDVGFTTDVNIANEINENYDSTLGKFIAENRTKLSIGEASLSTFFESFEYVNEARKEVTNLNGLNLTEITNLNQL